MERITVSFDDNTYNKLCENVENNNLPSLSFYVNQLVKVGLKVEEAAKRNEGNTDENNNVFDVIEPLKPFLEKLLSWSLESRLLTRYMLENFSEENKKKNKIVISQAADKAKEIVGRLLQQDIE